MSGGWGRDMMDYGGGGGAGMSGGGRGGGVGGGGAGDGRIYVGNLPADVREKDLEELFYKYGRIRDIELKSKRGLVPFAFVRFEDPRWVDAGGPTGAPVHGRGGHTPLLGCSHAPLFPPFMRGLFFLSYRPGGGGGSVGLLVFRLFFPPSLKKRLCFHSGRVL